MKKLFISQLIILLGSCICSAQGPGSNIVLHSVNEEDGLSDNHVQCVLKDRSGNVWIGTADGLNEMDGSAIYVFRNKKEDNTSLVNNNILSLAEDESGNIWIGTSGGLSCYFRQKNVFQSWLPEASPYGSSGYIYSIVIDRKKNIWCATHGGLLLFNDHTNLFRPFYNMVNDPKNSLVLRNRITHMIAGTTEQKLWISSADGLWSFSLDRLTFKEEITAKNDPQYKQLFTYVYESHDHTIWAGTWEEGLVALNKANGKVAHYFLKDPAQMIIRCINEIQQNDGKYMLFLDGDLSAFDPATNNFFHYVKLPKETENMNVLPCYKSPDGWIWLASSSGLYIYDPHHQFFQHHFFSKEITAQDVAFAEWNQSLLVGGGAKDFLKLYDEKWDLKKDFGLSLNLSAARRKSGVNPTVLSIGQDNNDLWLGTSSGILRMNTNTGNTKWFYHAENDSTSLPRNFITHIFLSSNKKIWVFPWREGIWTLDTETGKFKKLWTGFSKENGKLKKLVIVSATEDENGNLWMSDIDEGIILFDRKTGIFSKPFSAEIGSKVRTDKIFFYNGSLYSNTPDAVIKWGQSKKKLSFFYLPPEMSKEIYGIQPDHEGNWWIATNNGLIVFNEGLKTFRRFTSADGLLNNDMNGTLFCRSNGTVLFGTESYVTSFNPPQLLSAVGDVPQQQLKEVLVNAKPVEQARAKNNFHFDYYEKNIVFKWALPDFSNPFRNQYYCRLEGIDADWRYVGYKGEIQYANLNYGKYKLQLKAINANGVVSPNIISIPFEIAPPFWKASWFLGLVIFICAIIFFFIVRYVSQRNLKEKLLRLEKEQAVEKERNRISRDMHDDLGSGLTKIAIMSEVAKRYLYDHEKARQQLDNISGSSRELVDNLQDIIWVLNPKNDTLESLAAYTREYALKFFEPFKIEMHFIYPEKFSYIKLSEETRRNVFLAIKESFNNIGKHAWCNQVTMSIETGNNSIVINIKDDGRGFAANHIREFGNGLINMKNRIEQINGSYEIKSRPGAGTVTTIVIPA